MADDSGRWTEPALLVLTSLADGEKHGYAITTDIAQQVGVTLLISSAEPFECLIFVSQIGIECGDLVRR